MEDCERESVKRLMHLIEFYLLPKLNESNLSNLERIFQSNVAQWTNEFSVYLVSLPAPRAVSRFHSQLTSGVTNA